MIVLLLAGCDGAADEKPDSTPADSGGDTSDDSGGDTSDDTGVGPLSWPDIDVSAAEDVLLGVSPQDYAGNVAALPGGGLVVGTSQAEVVYVWQGPIGGRRSLGESARILSDPDQRVGFGTWVIAVGDEGLIGTGGNEMIAVFTPDSDVPSLRYELLCCGEGDLLAAGELTGDGAPDLVLSTYSTYVDEHAFSILLLDAGRTGDLTLGDEDGAIESAGGRFEGGVFGDAIVVLGDTDGDGVDDLLVDGRLLYRGPLQGTRAAEDYDAIAEDTSADHAARAGDMDGDGLEDVIFDSDTVSYDVTVSSLRHDGTWGAAEIIVSLTCEAQFISCGGNVWGGFDADHDGHPDVGVETNDYAAESGSGRLGGVIMHGPLAGVVSTEAGQHLPSAGVPAGWNGGLSATDLDEDGYTELALGFSLYEDTVSGQGAVFLIPSELLLAPDTR